MTYYTLIGREYQSDKYEIIFGDFERAVVEDERTDLEEDWHDLLIMASEEDQASIEKRLFVFNNPQSY